MKMHGQGYDGGSLMEGKFKDIQAQISADYPLALYVHCACHVLNLALTTASNLPSVRWSMRTIQDIITFYKGGQKHAAALKNAVLVLFPSYSKITLVSLCTTRWVERHDADRFVELFPAILQTLDTLEQVSDPDTSGKADILCRRAKEFEFVVNMLIIKFVAALMLTLSTNLQKVIKNLVTVCDLIQDDTRLLESIFADKIKYSVCRNLC